MKRKLLPFFLMLTLFCNAVGATKHYSCVVAVSKKNATVGDIVSVSIKLNGPGITAIVWNMYDKAFYSASDIRISTTRSSNKNAVCFEHVITFTSVKPGKLSIGALPVFLEDGQVETEIIKAFNVTFKPITMVSNINNIQPPVRLVAYYTYGLIFLLAIGVIITTQIAFNRFIKNQNTGMASINKVRKSSLKKLSIIASTGLTNSNTAMADRVFTVLKNFIDHVTVVSETAGDHKPYQQTMTIVHNMEVMNELMDTSAKLRFNEFYCTPDRLHSYLNNVELFIANFQFTDSL